MDGEYQRFQADGEGRLLRQVSGRARRLEARRLRLLNPVTGQQLLTPAEVRAAHRAEATARQRAEARTGQVEAERTRLRAALARRRKPGASAVRQAEQHNIKQSKVKT